MKKLLTVLVLVLFGASYSCAMKGGPANPPSVEGRLAQSGRQVIAAADSVLTGVDQLVTSNVLSKEDATRVVTVIRKVGAEGERLGQVLTVVDENTDSVARTKGLQQAGEILKVIQRLVVEAGYGVGNDAAREKVVGILGQITDIVVTIAMLFPSPAPVS